ncbi:MAG TPA: RluA family pseudouridine synthase [Thermoanaerobaculia bacterium]|nr:RluA family pseudouridine synthase [Thermoanaerobaculia bacterium]
MRLDQAVAARFPDISRRKARELIAERRVLVNDRPVAMASREVADDARIVIIDDVPDLAILRETAEWVAVNKPAGLPTQPTRDREQRSLEELLRMKYRQIFLVHRIDTPTSGAVLFARTQREAARLSELFAKREIRKTYVARISGSIEGELTIDTPVDGKEALTIVRPIGESLVEAEIRTGRTHQIRVHLASIGHPVAGDRRYGGALLDASRLMLHAWKLEHASIGVIEAPLPDDLIRFASPA